VRSSKAHEGTVVSTGSAELSLHVVPAREDDAGLVLRFIRELAEYERLTHEVVATEADIRTALFGLDPSAHAVIGYVNGEPAGFALYFFSFSTFVGRPGLYLEDLYVRPPFRGRGLGRRLLAHLARIAVERNCGRMEWSVLDWNQQALGFYRRLGARSMDEWTVQRLTGEALRSLAATAPAVRPPSDP
jgi:GNAT superfamily N-acetyltransferase